MPSASEIRDSSENSSTEVPSESVPSAEPVSESESFPESGTKVLPDPEIEIGFVSQEGAEAALPDDLRETITRYLDMVCRGDRTELAQIADELEAAQPFEVSRAGVTYIRFTYRKTVWLDENRAVVTMARETSNTKHEPSPLYCMIQAVKRDDGWFVTRACMLNYWAEGDEYVFISLEASGEEKAEVYKNLTSEYDPSWAEWILITEQIANFSWQEPAWSPYVPSVKSVVIWVSPSDDYIRLHPEMVYKALNGNPTAGHYFYCWYADEQTAAEGIAAQQPGWHAKPVYAFAPDFLEGDEYPHNRRLGQ